MTEQKQISDLSGVLPLIDESYEKILLSIQDDYKICNSSAKNYIIIFGYIRTELHRFVPQKCAALQTKKSVQ